MPTPCWREYPLADHPSPSEAFAAALTDRDWALPTEETRRLLARHVPVYAYEFAERNTPWFPGMPQASFPAGASHMLDLPYLFSVRYLTPAAQEDLRHTMIDNWTRFARTGHTAGQGSAPASTSSHWPPARRRALARTSEPITSSTSGAGGELNHEEWRSA